MDGGGRDGLGKYDREPPKWLTGRVLVPVALIAAALVVGTVVLLASTLLSPKPSPPAMLLVPVVNGPLAFFFLWVGRQMLASVRGKPVPHSFHPVIGIALAIFFGLACIVLLFAGRATMAAHTGVGLVFLLYAARETRRWWVARRAESQPAG